MAGPLVSVGIPTYNRPRTLVRAVESVLRQTYPRLDVAIFDNASTDETEEVARALAGRDSRVRYVRQPRNLGPEANFNAAYGAALGDYAMLVADDDWLADDYVERCLHVLQERPELSVAAGRPRYVRDGEEVPFGARIEMVDADASTRVRRYFASVDDNGPFYGLMRRAAVRAQPPMRAVLGFDWLWVAGLAFVGGVARVEDTSIFRELGGASETTRTNVRTSGLPSAHAKVPHLAIGWQVLSEIGWRSPVYEPLGRRRRLVLAAGCALSVPGRNLRHVLFHLLPARLQPAASRLARRVEAR